MKSLFILTLILTSYLMSAAYAQEDEAATEEPAGDAEGEAEESGDAEGEAEDSGAEEDAAATEPEGEGDAEGESEGEGDAEGESEGDAEGEVDEDEVEEEKAAETEASDDGEDGDASGSGDGEESGSGDAVAEDGSEKMAEILFECDRDGMDEKTAGCMDNLNERVGTLEQQMLSGGGGLEDQIALVLVKKGVIDCENDTQCADDRACLDSYNEPGRKMCEKPCDRHRCHVPYSECVAEDHKPRCDCKEEFHGNGTVACFPSGFEEQNNTRSYRMFDDSYVTFENASQKCQDLGARLPVLDSEESIQVVMNYLETAEFEVFEQWDRSSRRVWLGLIMDRSSGLMWADGQRVNGYPASSNLFVWEARRVLGQEASYADNSRHYALYIDGDIAKLPGGGRRGAAVLCELDPNMMRDPAAAPYDPYSDPRYQEQYQRQQQQQYNNQDGRNN